jgi:hypothetical protein
MWRAGVRQGDVRGVLPEGEEGDVVTDELGRVVGRDGKLVAVLADGSEASLRCRSRTRYLGVRLTKTEKDLLDGYCRVMRMTRSEVVRGWIRGLDCHEAHHGRKESE